MSNFMLKDWCACAMLDSSTGSNVVDGKLDEADEAHASEAFAGTQLQ